MDNDVEHFRSKQKKKIIIKKKTVPELPGLAHVNEPEENLFNETYS